MSTVQHAVRNSRFNQRSKIFSTPATQAWILKPLYASLLCLFSGLALPAWAQDLGPSKDPIGAAPQNSRGTLDDGTPHDTSTQPRNAFADKLRPRVKRPTVLQNQPYTPIKKQDDQAQVPEIEMFVGESRVFPAPGVARIAVGNGQIMTAAALDSKEVLIFANGVGTSSLFVWNEDGRYQRVKINIVPGDTTRIAREVAAFLTTIPHAKASIVGDKVIVEGDNLSDADLSKIEQLEKRYPQIINFTNRIGWEQMVMMDVKIVEFPKTELREIGLKWAATGGAAVGAIWGPGRRGSDGPYQLDIQTGQNNSPPITNPDGVTGVVVPSSLNVLSVANLGLNAQLNLLEQEGKASVLAEPQLSARNGAKATFLAGGEFPYSVSSINGVTIIFKKYGINLEIAPKVDRNGVIRATVEAEVSSIDASISTPAGPALLTRRTNTEFNVTSGDTIVLSGLLQRNSSTDIDKVPVLGDIPMLGALFRSKRFQNKETELVVFVTPTVIDSRSPGLVDRVERTKERLQQQLGRQPYLSDPLQPGLDPARTDAKPPMPQSDIEDGSATSDPTAAPSAVSVIEPAPVTMASTDAPIIAIASERSRPAVQNIPEAIPPLAAGGSILRVTKDGLVMRTEPNAQSRSMLQLGYGAVVQLGTADPQPRGIGRWRNVVVGEMSGWVLADGVEPSHMQPTIKAIAESAVARSDQDGAALTVGSSAKGGGVSPGSVQQVTPAMPAAGDAANGAQPKRFRVALERVALRVTPDVNAAVIRNLPKGQLVEALPQPPSGYWIAVQADGVRGWAASQWLNPVAIQN